MGERLRGEREGWGLKSDIKSDIKSSAKTDNQSASNINQDMRGQSPAIHPLTQNITIYRSFISYLLLVGFAEMLIFPSSRRIHKI